MALELLKLALERFATGADGAVVSKVMVMFDEFEIFPIVSRVKT
jgi:hypothetical protein